MRQIQKNKSAVIKERFSNDGMVFPYEKIKSTQRLQNSKFLNAYILLS